MTTKQRPDILMHCRCGAAIQIESIGTYDFAQKEVLDWWKTQHTDCKPPAQRACTHDERLEKLKRGYYGP